MTDHSKPEDDDTALAAEYVVGLLPRDERNAVESRIRRDNAFALLVEGWEDYFAGLNQEYGTTPPAKRVKAVIDQRLFPAPQRRLVGWFSAALGASLLASVLVIGSFSVPVGTGPNLVAALESGESPYRFTVEVGSAASTLEIALVSGEPVTDRTFELWLLPPDGAPLSLGTFDQSGPLIAASSAILKDGGILAVSLEPIGGSSTGAPTGPVLAVGALSDA